MFGENINVKVDLSNYATKADFKNVRGVETSKLTAKSSLVNLKAEIDKLDVDKLKTTHVDLTKLSNAINSEAVKKTVYKLCKLSLVDLF